MMAAASTNDIPSFQPMDTDVINNPMSSIPLNSDAVTTATKSSIDSNVNIASNTSVSGVQHPSKTSNATPTRPPSGTNTFTSHTQSSSQHTPNQPSKSTVNQPTNINNDQILTKTRLQDLVKEIDPCEQLDEEVEDLLLQLVDDFVNSTVNTACAFAKHRNANTVDVKDVQLYLEKMYQLWIPGFGTEEVKPYKKPPTTEAHKQRLALIKKSLRKY